MSAAAVLFDLDGLLIDSEPVWFEVEHAVVTRLGGTWVHADQAQCIGGTIDRTCAYILERTGPVIEAAELAQELVATMADRLRSSLPLRDGAAELLDALRERAVPLGLVTSSYQLIVEAALDALGHDRFRVTVSGEDVTHGKPHPEPYLTACAGLAVAPARVVVLEDAPYGVMSAEAAGCVAVAVPEVAPIEPTPRRPVFRSLRDIDVDWLLDLA